MSATRGEIPVSDHLRKLPPAVRATVQAARRTVKAIAPKANEVTYQSRPSRSGRSMWKLVHYAVDGAYVAGIGTYPGYASLFFLRGRELDDASGLLEGGGKDMRFIRLRTPVDAKRPALRRIVRRAFALGGATMRRDKR